MSNANESIIRQGDEPDTIVTVQNAAELPLQPPEVTAEPSATASTEQAVRGYDDGNEECPAYRPTRFELAQLAKYWAKVRLEDDLMWFYYSETRDCDCWMNVYSSDRLKDLGDVLGAEVVIDAVATAEREQRKKMSAEEWRVFVEGTFVEREDIRVEIAQRRSYLRLKKEDEATQERAFAHLSAKPSSFYLDDAGDLWSLRESSRDDKQLVLSVTTSEGCRTLVPKHKMPLPANWHPPFGLR